MMKKVCLFTSLVVAVAIQGCASTIGSPENLNNFKQYQSNMDITEFCTEHPLETQSKQQCLNNLIVYRRSLDECKKSVSDKSCFRRQQNKWDYFYSNVKSSAQYVTNEFDEVAFDKAMEKHAKSFELTCFNSSEEIVKCADL